MEINNIDTSKFQEKHLHLCNRKRQRAVIYNSLKNIKIADR